MSNELAVQTHQSRGVSMPSVFANKTTFDESFRIARALSSSELVPVAYRGEDKVPNTMIAMDMANRINVSPIVVMQNLHVIEGRPSWSSQFIVSALNSCGLFSPIRYKLEKLGEREVTFETWEGPKGSRNKVTKKTKVNDMTCTAYAIEKSTGEILEGPTVSIATAVAEGWYFRPGSKWLTMPDLMLRYRAAAFFGRLYAPHILNGMPSEEEVYDVPDMRDVTPEAPAEVEPVKEKKPAGRPRGVHAAMAGGKKASEAAAEPVTIDVAAETVDEMSTSETSQDDGDMFDSPYEGEDDDYQPA